jgi:predicted GNAT family acetyltransferase
VTSRIAWKTGQMSSASTTLEHDRDAHQYRLTKDGAVVSLADYRPLDDGTTLVFHHTLTPPAHRGNGYAAMLIGQALDDVRAAGQRVVPSCWFVEEFLGLHPEYEDLRA